MDATHKPTVSRDGFIYSDGKLYVEVDGHFHAREDAASLYALLTSTPPPPPLNKSGKPLRKKAKTDRDRDAHFYSAQLFHYGLVPRKTRASAKKGLLCAFRDKTLEVPRAILELENALSKEWHKVNLNSQRSNKRRLADTNPQEYEYEELVPAKKARSIDLALKGKSLDEIAEEIDALAVEKAYEMFPHFLPVGQGISRER
ncbi:hypothetical protein BDZ97DRAFT_1442760 [Flammula alnicola]|nr:hypothetical protein BDZ97DRAFT_1442760 [Flammula alnicola]